MCESVCALVCVLAITTVSLSPVDVHTPDITWWRLLSVSNIKLSAPQRKKKRCVVYIQVVEVSGVSDEKMNLIAYWSPSGNSHFHGSGGFSVLLDGIHQVFWISACWCSYLSEHKVVYVPPQTFFFFSFIIHCVRLLHPRTWPLKIRQSC